ncbi:hypothetical protein AXK11_06205 [Cephaloticoccus primus]|uniref:Cell division protein FtsZ n=1 Tax=Cephaloticoccus primus TaxID=1548207 RepID=A0A139SLP2_9BACT|nr:hypothetical protein AXK11_06205 [Cephaloticoccus primus]
MEPAGSAPDPARAAASASSSLSELPPVLLKLVGVGGAGVNIATRLSAEALAGLPLAVVDCDAQKLADSSVAEKCLLGEKQRRGLSAGGDAELGRQAAEASREKIAAVGGGADLVFVVTGLGGGTGSAAAPMVAAEAAKAGGLVIGFAVLPFSFEGGRRVKQADAALVALRRVCDAVIVLPNDLLLQESAEGASALAAFEQADAWIARAVRAIWGLLHNTGLINLDFAALQRAFEYRGSKTVFGLAGGAEATSAVGGEGREGTAGAAQALLASLPLCPLLHMPEGARRADRLLVVFTGGRDALSLSLVNTVVQALGERFGRAAELIVGATIDESMGERVELCFIGTSDIGHASRRRFGEGRAGRATAAGGTEGAGGAGRTAAARSGETHAAEAAAATVAPTQFQSGAESTDARRKPAPPPPADPFSPLSKAGSAGVFPSAIHGFGKSSARAAAASATTAQDEFGFSESTERGYFQDTDNNLFEGQDLDVPTYRRKGIKITV